MIQREVTVGRAPDSDILYEPGCIHVSNAHAMIYSDGTRLIFKDTSTNGTVINNRQIHHQSVVIYYGDSILLAGKYPLTWDRISVFFPTGKTPTQVCKPKTVINAEHQEPMAGGSQIGIHPSMPTGIDKARVEVEITRFNWGAFFLYPLWGFANGMWWLFLIAMFFWWLSPVTNIIFGIMGSKWAWQNKRWQDLNHFVSVQDSWKKWGIGVFLANVFLGIMVLLIVSIVS